MGESTANKPRFLGPHCDIISAILERRGWSVKRLASETGGDDSRLSKIVRGIAPLTHVQVQKLEAASVLTASERAVCRRVAAQHMMATSRGVAPEADTPEAADPAVLRRVSAARRKMARDEIRDVKKGRFFVTTAVQGAPVRGAALSAVTAYCAEHRARLIILPSRAHLRPLSDTEYPLDDIILEHHWQDVYKSYRFNQHLTALDLDIRPYKTDPLTGLSAYGAAEQHSYLFAHTTQRMQLQPNPRGHHPRMQQCTGAITEPVYFDTTSGELAFDRHIMGGLIVEIDRDLFHVRKVQFGEDGSFYDLADGVPRRYSAAGVEPARARLLSRGDDHGGPSVWGDEVANAACDQLTAELQPDVVTVEDVFDGASINPHAAKSISQVLGTPAAATTLAAEGEATAAHLSRIRATMRDDAILVIKPANHSRFLNRYLDGGKWTEDRVNYLTALDLAVQYHKYGHDPVRCLIDMRGELGTWLQQDESFVVEGVECGFHLDQGVNGGPASNRAHATAHGRAVGGHVHTPSSLWGVDRSGTMSRLRLGYNTGPSSHAHAVVVVWPGGQRTHVIMIGGKYRL